LSGKFSIQKLAQQTAIYGMGTILGRVLNYLLTPLYTGIFSEEVFGIYSVAYAYIAILLVVLTYGMETAMFNFCQKARDPKLVLSTGLISLLVSTSIFWLLIFSHRSDLANFMNRPGHEEYVDWLGLIIGLDALTALPMAWLRYTQRPKRFTVITLINILVNIGLNLYFLVYCRSQYLSGSPNALVEATYDHNIGVGYIFIANLAASLVKAFLCMPILRAVKVAFDLRLLFRMLNYGWPLLLAGLGFIISERLDVILLENWLPMSPEEARHEVGVYSACYKLAILMSIFIQAYRFAAEPFFFSMQSETNSRKVYARTMNYFTALCCFILLLVCLHIEVFKHFIRGEGYWEGLKIVPIIMLGNLFLGIYINLSMWYKLSGQTYFGAIFAVVGAGFTLILNALLIPRMGYMGSAIATITAYGAMMVISYNVGQRYYPIPYNVRKLFLYIGLSSFLVFVSWNLPSDWSFWFSTLVNTFLMLPFIALVAKLEPDLKKFSYLIVQRIWKKK
jgi:O-antigen/teichoic acid export membrane protein